MTLRSQFAALFLTKTPFLAANVGKTTKLAKNYSQIERYINNS
jgi:hypothetical protein